MLYPIPPASVVYISLVQLLLLLWLLWSLLRSATRWARRVGPESFRLRR